MSTDAPPTVRPARDEDWPEIIALDARSFALPAPLPDEEVAEFRATLAGAYVVDDPVFGGSGVAAASMYHHLPMTVPGGAIADTAGLTWVSVAATHRRRGLLRAMMAAQLAQWRADGLPLATLTASEGGIYERFGFGPACFADTISIDPGAVRWRAPAPADSRVRYGTPDAVAAAIPALHQRWARTRPGAIGRPAAWWPSRLADREFRRDPQTSGLHYLLHDDGYASYRLDARDRRALVDDFCAATPQAHTDLWRVLTGLDLVSSITAGVPVDDTLPLALRNHRAVTVTGRHDTLWVSILDVPGALGLRTYGTDGTVRLELTGGGGGRDGAYLLTIDERRGSAVAAASSEAVSSAAPVARLSIATLSSMYTGGIGARRLTAAGRIETDAETAELLDAMFATDRAPFAGTFF